MRAYKRRMILLLLLSALLLIGLLACGRGDDTAGTRVGTETTVSYSLTHPGSGVHISGVVAARSVSFQAPLIASYLDQVGESAESWERTGVAEDSGGVLSIPEGDLFNLDFYSSDSTYGQWYDSLRMEEFPEFPELNRTVSVRLLVSFRPEEGRYLFAGFAGRDIIAQILPDSLVSLGIVPMGERSVQMWEVLQDSLGNIQSVKEYSTPLQQLRMTDIGIDSIPDVILQLPEPGVLDSMPEVWVARPD